MDEADAVFGGRSPDGDSGVSSRVFAAFANHIGDSSLRGRELWVAMTSRPDLLANADLITMWGLTIVGACLMLGLFTRLASIAGIGFILLFYLAAPPFVGYFYTVPSEGSYLIVNKNLVEAAARRSP